MSIRLITVREYARLTTEPVPPSLDCAQVPPSAFNWLCDLQASFSRRGAALLQQDGRRALKLDSYVGVIETPCGTRLEILPKHTEQADCQQAARHTLQRMLQTVLDLPARESGPASLRLFDDVPLSEWVMRQFLQGLDHLVKRGVRFDYKRVEEEQRFLRGQLSVVAQMRQPPGRQHHFQIRHDVFLADRAENRLLRLALERVCKCTQEAGNWRLAHELRSLLLEVPLSRNIRQDFRQWQNDRLMAHYQPLRPWCELILGDQSPLAISGEWRGISMLFPMEVLFERYVEVLLRRQLLAGSKLRAQLSGQDLCLHQERGMFRLKPDLLLDLAGQNWVLDTKWKLLDAGAVSDKYGLSQADFYQMFAYGQKYLAGSGDMLLIYPCTERFQKPLPLFEFSPELRLQVVPFDLESGILCLDGLITLPLASGGH
ncbi:MAG: restriction endonuclease [Pseudomonas sp.]|nr:restriction endonuclease [Pseudomonas sp.]MAQ51469.1 restriction endonuclease [Pseudomonas sp.]